MNEHQTRVHQRDQGYRAECACGWTGPFTNYATAAMLDGHAHAKAAKEAEEPVKAWGDRE